MLGANDAGRARVTGGRAVQTGTSVASPATIHPHPTDACCRAVIKATMDKLKGTPAEGRVSYADLIALGGAHAVRITGGPVMRIPVGAFGAGLWDSGQV